MTRNDPHLTGPRWRNAMLRSYVALLLLVSSGAAPANHNSEAAERWYAHSEVSKSAQGAVIEVTTTDDDLTDNGNCSLREAVRAANTNTAIDACTAGTGADTIILPAGTFTLNLVGEGDLDIVQDVTIHGAGRLETTIDGAGLDRIFSVLAGADLTMTRLTTTGGRSTSAGSAIYVGNGSTLTLFRVQVTDMDQSAAIFLLSGSGLTATSSRIEGNGKGGIFAQTNTSVMIRDTSISGNQNDGNGGGIFNSGTMMLVNSTLSGNVTDYHGGAIINSGMLHLHNVTISGNVAGAAGLSGLGGGIYVLGGGTAMAVNSILSGNDSLNGVVGHRDCVGALVSDGFNLIENTTHCTISGSATGDIYGVDADLAPLSNNGGGTLTHRLRPASPAIDAGNPAGCGDETGAPISTDQRGFVRIGTCDMGAFEAFSPGPEPLFDDGFESQ